MQDHLGATAPASHHLFNSIPESLFKSVEQSARRLRSRWVEVDDLKQVGLLALWKATQTYDPARGIPFANYARRALVNAMLSEHRPAAKARHISYDSESASGNDSVDQDQGSALESLVSEDDNVLSCVASELRRIVASESSPLTKRQAEVVSLLYWDDMSVSEVGEKLKMTQQNVSKLHQKALKVLRKHYGVGHAVN